MNSENSKIVICLDSFSKHINNILVISRLTSVFETTALLKNYMEGSGSATIK